MKISCLVLLVMSGALTLAVSNALASNAAPQQSAAAANTPSEHPTAASSSDIAKPLASTMRARKRRVQQRNAKANHITLPASLAKTNRLKHPADRQVRSATATPRVQPQSRLTVVTRKGAIQNKSVTSVSPVRQPGILPSSSPSFDNQHHRGPNPAVIGGLGTLRSSETGAINGSHVSRKP
jgi:hypothetical protein